MLLACLAIPAIWVAAGNTANTIHLLRHAPEMVDLPFRLQPASRRIGSREFSGNQLLGINGHPFTRPLRLERMLANMRPGEPVMVLMSEPDGHAVERKVMLSPMAGRDGVSLPTAAVWMTLDCLIPGIALALGLATVLIRPRDRNAWLLLLMLLAFSEVSRAHRWAGPVPGLTWWWTAAALTLWPPSMMLFGIYFPEQQEADRKYPWAKYLVLVPSLVCPLLFWATSFVWEHDVNRGEALRSLHTAFAAVQVPIGMIAIGSFFANIGHKSGTSRADASRRLSILWIGASIALSPMFVAVLIGLVRHTEPLDGLPSLAVMAILLCLLLFPLTLAYVIVIERAMDLRFVIRQSVQYGVLRGGIWVLRAGLAVIGVYLMRNAGAYMDTWRQAGLVGVGVALLLVRGRAAKRAGDWIDRRFFREAYDAEKLLTGLAAEVGGFLTVGPLLERVTERIGTTLHVPDISVLLRNGDRFELAWTTRQGQPVQLASDGSLVRSLHSPIYVDFERPTPLLSALSAEEIQALDWMHSEVLLPIPGKDGLAGILSLGPKLSEVPYSPSDLRLLEGVVTQVGLAIENSRLSESLANAAAQRERLRRDLEIAREVQQRLFPQVFPPVPGVDYSAFCRPALGVGGDYYDFLALPDGSLGIAIGDVSGKGIAAALLMASLQASLRGQIMANLRDLSALMINVNRLVFEASNTNRYATFFYGRLEPQTRCFTYVNAGHNAPMLFRNGEVIRLDTGGPVIGLLPGAQFEQGFIQLQSGDILLAFTDGISEAMNSDDDEWEEERMVAAVRALARLPAAEMIDRLLRAADAFVNGAPQHDDMTLIVAKII